jgi:hypothetical protein
MTETTSSPDTPTAESPRIQDCVDQILAKVDGDPAAG